MLRLFAFVEIIFRSSIKTGLLLWSLSRSAEWEERREKGGGGEIMDRPRLPPSDRTSALQGICLNIRQTHGAGETNHPTLIQQQSSKRRIIYCFRIMKKFIAYDLVQ